ncbi:HEAT repeat domain-containing protein [uncultured Psychrobacillus sp.]|uniref:HEAT repeat domain-containing protein n=1 Tax=uncultured Psychrobacillus sp. TaxID=1551585 RepID=UPI002635A936|nr:HEAT repeat domain-containing protein [uncultured Psychrobacillus sp.]
MAMIQISIKFVLLLICLLTLLLVSIGLYLIIKRVKEVKIKAEIASYVSKHEENWRRFLIEGVPFNPEVIPKSREEIIGIEVIFSTYLKNLSNESIQEKISQFSNEYLKDFYLKLLQSKSWSKRMNAMFHIEDFKIDSLEKDCEKLGKKRISREEYFQLLKIYSLFNKNLFLQHILISNVQLSEYEYKKLLLNLPAELLDTLTDKITDLPKTCRYALIDTLGLKRDIEYLPHLEVQLQQEDIEIRIKSLRAIYEIGFINNPENYLAFVKSPVWEERLMVAKLFQLLPLSYTLPHLEILLEDESWWVRSQAAKTMMRDKSGRTSLEEYIEHSSDRYAIDMANEALGKGLKP